VRIHNRRRPGRNALHVAEETARATSEGAPLTVENVRHPDTFVLVLVMLIATIGATMGLPETAWARGVIVALQSATVLLAGRVSGMRARSLRLLAAIVVGTLAVSLLGILVDSELATGATRFLGTLLVLLGPVCVVHGLRRQRSVNREVIAAALCIYLFIGLAFASLYQGMQDVADEPFFSNGQTATMSDSTYFSFVTLATVGYGDYTAAGKAGRSFAVLEALLGQLYLVTVVALVVSNVGREVRPRRPLDPPAP